MEEEGIKIPEDADFTEVTKELDEKLASDEKIRLIACVSVDEGRGNNYTVLSNHRLILMRRGEFRAVGSSEIFKDFPFHSIESMDIEERKGYDLLVLFLKSGESVKFMIPEGSGPEITSFLRKVESEKKKEEKAGETPTQKLEKLSDLKDRGAVTEEEFEEKKKEILEDI